MEEEVSSLSDETFNFEKIAQPDPYFRRIYEAMDEFVKFSDEFSGTFLNKENLPSVFALLVDDQFGAIQRGFSDDVDSLGLFGGDLIDELKNKLSDIREALKAEGADLHRAAVEGDEVSSKHKVLMQRVKETGRGYVPAWETYLSRNVADENNQLYFGAMEKGSGVLLGIVRDLNNFTDDFAGKVDKSAGMKPLSKEGMEKKELNVSRLNGFSQKITGLAKLVADDHEGGQNALKKVKKAIDSYEQE
ncbi:hypothetical protein [Streptomyces sp. 1222.5]|uniref:hypothetical protein n=1 Tax=Streptomyces sp. 1222.5 TaxID=1881026 RepID=UPI003D757F13